MKIIRLAIREEIKDKVLQKEEDLPFDNIFGDKLRLVIPIESENLQFIVKSLQEGDTKTKTKYKVDLVHKVAYRLMNKDGVIKLDPRPMKLGRVIRKEMGDKWADSWSVESSSEDSDEKSVILSRSPIDVVRMSNHDGIYSCHSPSREYFTHAVDEALSGGAIAYVVDNADLEEYLLEHGSLQSEDIFKDSDRSIEGIIPLSRVRVNRYVDDDGNEIALPVNHNYGENTSGFLDTVTDWLKAKQSDSIDYDNLDLSSYKRTGGRYADAPDRNIIENFFGDNRGVTKDLPHIGGDSRLDIWSEEIATMEEEANAALKHSSISGNVDESDGYVYINGYGYVSFVFRGYINDTDWMEANYNKYRNTLNMSLGYVNYIDVGNENGMSTVRFNIDMEDINTPDDWEATADEFERYEKTDYYNDLKLLKEILVDNGILYSVGDAEDYIRDTGLEEYTNEMDLYFATNLPLINFDDKLDELREHVKVKFMESVSRNVRMSGDGEQATFDFYDKSQDYSTPTYMDTSLLKLNYSVNIPDHTVANFVISIPYAEVYRIGKRYFESLDNAYNAIYNDIYGSVQKFINEHNVSVSGEVNGVNGVKGADVVARNWYSLCKYANLSRLCGLRRFDRGIMYKDI